MDINYELYKVFYHVATTLSFSEAANKLFISQSASKPVYQSIGKKIKSKAFYQEYQKGTAWTTGRRTAFFVMWKPAMNLIHQDGKSSF